MEQKLQYIVDKIGELNIQINEKQAEQFLRYYELHCGMEGIHESDWYH